MQPWGKIEGTVLQGGTPASGEQIHLKQLVWDFSAPVDVHYNTETDAQWHFTFEKLPAGEFSLSLMENNFHTADGSMIETCQMPVSVRAGETQTVTLGSAGTTVIGNLQAPTAGTTPVWTNAIALLKRDVPIPTQPARGDYVTEASHRAARIAFTRDPAVQAAFRENKTFAGHMAEDGAVTFENVPPGRYIMEVTLLDKSPDDLNPNSEIGMDATPGR